MRYRMCTAGDARAHPMRSYPSFPPSLPPSSSQQAQDLTRTSSFFQGARDPLEGKEEGEEGGRDGPAWREGTPSLCFEEGMEGGSKDRGVHEGHHLPQAARGVFPADRGRPASHVGGHQPRPPQDPQAHYKGEGVILCPGERDGCCSTFDSRDCLRDQHHGRGKQGGGGGGNDQVGQDIRCRWVVLSLPCPSTPSATQQVCHSPFPPSH